MGLSIGFLKSLVYEIKNYPYNSSYPIFAQHFSGNTLTVVYESLFFFAIILLLTKSESKLVN